MQTLLRDAQILYCAANKVQNVDQMALLEKIAACGENYIDDRFQACLKLEEQFLANQDKSLCLENFWLDASKKYARLSL